MIIKAEKRYTPEEYLELDEKAEYKLEYRNGAIIPMAGGTTNHNKIAGNFYKLFPLTVQGQAYETYIGDIRLWIPRYHLYTYPDIMIVRGKPIYEGTGTTTITNPCLIVEVLSKSTKDYDKTDKFKYYRSIPELQEYILIDQYSFSVEHFTKRAEGEWSFKEAEGEDAVLILDSFPLQINFRDLYARVDFDVSEE